MFFFYYIFCQAFFFCHLVGFTHSIFLLGYRSTSYKGLLFYNKRKTTDILSERRVNRKPLPLRIFSMYLFSGPVCGQDPLYCTAPLSSYAATWPDNITQWPICHVSSIPQSIGFLDLSRSLSPAPRHMTCERISRPCCIGIHGRCQIETQVGIRDHL